MTTTSPLASRMKNVLLIVWVLALVQVSCKAPLTPTPAANLPDLAISDMSLEMQGQAKGGCVDAYGPYEVVAIIVNQGTAPAKDIVVERIPGAQAWIEMLAPGKRAPVRFPADAKDGRYALLVDPQNKITESDENNNSRSFLAPTPTPPPLCHPAQPSTPAVPASTLPAATLAGLVYNALDLAQVWSIRSGGQPVKLLDGVNPRISPNGHQAVYEADGDLWIADLAEGVSRNLTNTPDHIEGNAQWWPANPTKIVFSLWSSTGILSMIDAYSSQVETLGEAPSLSMPSLRRDGKTIAYDMDGIPEIYEIGEGTHPFDALSFGLEPESRVVYTSPAWSPDGESLLWWVVQPEKTYTLVRFDLAAKSYSILHEAQLVGGTQGWFPNPLWSPDGQWVAYQTRGETTLHDLTIARADGSQEYRLGLATDPVWSQDSLRLVYTQWPPRADSYLAASVSIIDVPSWETKTVDLPDGSVPIEWMKPLP